jgi:hypothetical protein
MSDINFKSAGDALFKFLNTNLGISKRNTHEFIGWSFNLCTVITIIQIARKIITPSFTTPGLVFVGICLLTREICDKTIRPSSGLLASVKRIFTDSSSCTPVWMVFGHPMFYLTPLMKDGWNEFQKNGLYKSAGDTEDLLEWRARKNKQLL